MSIVNLSRENGKRVTVQGRGAVNNPTLQCVQAILWRKNDSPLQTLEMTLDEAEQLGTALFAAIYDAKSTSGLAAAPQAPSGQLAEPSDEQLDALMPDPEEKGEPWRDEYGYEKWDYNFNKAQVRQAMRAAIASQQSERPAPAGQAVGDMTDTRLMRIASEQSVSFEVAMRPIVRTWGTELRGFLNAALAASQAERPASLHSWLTNFREAEKREPTPVEIWCAAIDCVSPPAPAGQAVGEEKATRAQIIEWLDALDIEVTDKQLNGLFLAALAASQAK